MTAAAAVADTGAEAGIPADAEIVLTQEEGTAASVTPLILEKPPAGVPWQEYAWRRLTEANPFPSVMGRVCPAPCESGCNRNEVEDFVGINSVEGFLGELAIEHGWKVDPPAERSGKRLLVVGAGPSGLSAAYHLARLGHEVTIHEAGPMTGSQVRAPRAPQRAPVQVPRVTGSPRLLVGVGLESARAA